MRNGEGGVKNDDGGMKNGERSVINGDESEGYFLKEKNKKKVGIGVGFSKCTGSKQVVN